MKIILEYVATLKITGPATGSVIEIPDGSSVTDLFNHLEIRPAHQRVLAAFVSNEKVHRDSILSDGDHVFIGMPVGGG